MNRFDAPGSIFAPIVAAVPPDTQWGGFSAAAEAAKGSIPVSSETYRVTRRFRLTRVPQVRNRLVGFWTGDSAKPFTCTVRLYDRPPEQTSAIAMGETLWEVGISHLKKGLCEPAVPAAYDVAMLQVSAFKLHPAGISGAPQLALFRHLWAAAVLGASPGAIVFGGQHQWDDSWWREGLAEAVAGVR